MANQGHPAFLIERDGVMNSQTRISYFFLIE